MVMDFKAIEDFWFGKVETPKFPLEPLDLGVSLSDEAIEFRDPFEGLRSKEEPEGQREETEASEETPEPEGETQDDT